MSAFFKQNIRRIRGYVECFLKTSQLQGNERQPCPGTEAEPGILPCYSDALPSSQSMLDIFKGHWKSRLPAEYGLVAGDQPMFEDTRVHWGNSHIPGGITGKSVLELGPFEAYNTLHLQQHGAREILSIEGNNINFLKCLVLKEVLGLQASFLHGDFCTYLAGSERRFDIIWASGVLYHQRAPLELLTRIAQHTDLAFFWTHYYDESVLHNHHRPYFIAEQNTRLSYEGYECPHYCRSYLLSSDGRIPTYFEGGNASYAYWLPLEDIYGCLKTQGMTEITVQHQGDLDGLPVVAFLAHRPLPC